MKISQFENEEALDLLVAILEPTTKIFSDEKVRKMFKNSKTKKIEIVKDIVKLHKKEIIEILAALDGKEVGEYKGNVVTMTTQILELFNDPVLNDFFSSQVQQIASASSGSHTESTEEKEN